ncbi:MAG TPA: extracellular solute-binding protein, partial [Roseiarcus sp.]|nr:extracellular solute-binding protein [Roseiarcus sp.]
MRLSPILLALAALVATARADEPPTYAIAMHGAPALGPDFARLPYADPDAPKGGRLALAYLGAFDSLNPYNVKALSAAQGLVGNVYQSLMTRSADEPFTLYGLVARSIETDDARDRVAFHLDPRAHFSDGERITAADVVFSFNLLKAKGLPSQRAAYALARKVEAPDDLTVLFDLAGADDRELPLILAMMPVLSRVHTDAERFEDQTLQIPVGSGPYRVVEVVPGERLTLRRDPNYWGRDLPVNRGLYNFDEIRIDYYRDASAMFEAFKAGLYDFRFEDDPNRWLNGYDFPAARDGRIVRRSVPYGLPKGVSGFAFNTRRAIFADARAREALATMFDFEWINANLYSGVYKRSRSFFDDSELSSAGRPASEKERALLAPFPGAVRDDVMEGRWSPPASDGSGRDRRLARRALDLLEEAGYALRRGALANSRGEPLAFEILVKNRQEERLALAYSRSLSRIGVDAAVRLVDEVQFQRRRARFDFDMMIGSWIASPSPGNEQRGRWGSAAAEMEGAYNICGAASPAIDAMIAAVVAARGHDDFVAAVRALDRTLLSGFYIVPL